MLTVESFWRDFSQFKTLYKQTDTHYLLAYSGGLDSHVLLHLLVEFKHRRLIDNLDVIHINHQLHPDASQWAVHCVKQCNQYKLNCTVLNVSVDKNTGKGLEAAAREARYNAFKTLMTAKTLLLTAQHADDQVETFLLQSLRGGGVKGLAAMPLIKPFVNGYLCRPLLVTTQQAIVDYARQQNLSWLDDPSNANLKFDRNYLRQKAIPVLKQRWPGLHKTIRRVTEHQAENKKLVDELAQLDLEQLQIETNPVSINALQTLPVHRQKNVLRYWLHHVCKLTMPDTIHLERIVNEVLNAAADSQPCVSWHGARVQRYQGKLYADKPEDISAVQTEVLVWRPEKSFEIAGRQLVTEQCCGKGLSVKQLQSKQVNIRFRQGGEMCRPQGRAEHHHKLKKLFQEWQVPPWQRNRIPLIYVEDELAQVVGYCLCEPFVAAADEVGYQIRFE